MSFEQQIQQWVTIDNQMKIVADKMKELRDKKNEIIDIIKEQTTDKICIICWLPSDQHNHIKPMKKFSHIYFVTVM